MTRLRSEITFGAGVLLLLQLLTAFAAVGLLSRVSPAVEQILEENVTSTEAVEDMLIALATPGGIDAEAFDDALRRAERNITIPDERPLLARLRADRDGVMADEPEALRDAILALKALSAVNRGSMQSADEAAQRIGVSGAWAAVLLGFSAFGVGVGVIRRLRTRVEDPILELDATLDAARGGDNQRRCARLTGPDEIIQMGAHVNWLLDQLSHEPQRSELDTRRALLAVLDLLPEPTIIVSPEGERFAENQAAFDVVTTPLLSEIVRHPPKPPSGRWAVQQIRFSSLRLVRSVVSKKP
ncbi:MAG: hypothetical protein AAFV53_35330 [Myxococcota bacterium]